MARYKSTCRGQGLIATVYLDDQIQPGTFEYTVDYLVDHELDLSIFDGRFRNDETGAPAYNPRILLKVILLAYSRGITSSRKIARCCEENFVFRALSDDTRPHFTTIANFISSIDNEIVILFRRVLQTCDEMGLIGKQMFAIDGCKLPSNASKEWSGTQEGFKKKAAKIEKAIGQMMSQHRENDHKQTEESLAGRDEKYIAKLRKKLAKIRHWVDNNDDKLGKSGKPIQSNITDNDSAKMKSSHGYIQGYDGVTAVDSKHQVIVHAEAFGQAQENDLLKPMVDGTRENFQQIDKEDDIFKKAKLSTDAGFHSEENMKMLFAEGIDAYVADGQFRKRDPLFADYDRHKQRHRKELAQKKRRARLFQPCDFIYDKEKETCICPAGKPMYLKYRTFESKGYKAVAFIGWKTHCRVCALRPQCLKYPDRTEARQVHFFEKPSSKEAKPFTARMKRKIDTAVGRALYGMRLAVAEPPFANICHAIGLDRFSLRGKPKVNVQWNLFCIVHNVTKIHRYGTGFA